MNHIEELVVTVKKKIPSVATSNSSKIGDSEQLTKNNHQLEHYEDDIQVGHGMRSPLDANLKMVERKNGDEEDDDADAIKRNLKRRVSFKE